MVVDTSALIAIMSDEPERRRFNQLIEAAPSTYVSAASLLEARIVLFARSGDSAVLALDAFLLRSGMIVTEVSPRIAEVAFRRLPAIWQGIRSSSGSELRRLFRLRPGSAPGSAAAVQGRRLPAHRHPLRRGRVIGLGTLAAAGWSRANSKPAVECPRGRSRFRCRGTARGVPMSRGDAGGAGRLRARPGPRPSWRRPGTAGPGGCPGRSTQ